MAEYYTTTEKTIIFFCYVDLKMRAWDESFTNRSVFNSIKTCSWVNVYLSWVLKYSNSAFVKFVKLNVNFVTNLKFCSNLVSCKYRDVCELFTSLFLSNFAIEFAYELIHKFIDELIIEYVRKIIIEFTYKISSTNFKKNKVRVKIQLSIFIC